MNDMSYCKQPQKFSPTINKIRMRYADELVESRMLSPKRSELELDLKRRSSGSFSNGPGSSRISRATSFSQINIMSKLDNLEMALGQMQGQLSTLRAEANASLMRAQTIKEQLYNKLEGKNNDLTKRISHFEKFMNKAIQQENDRFNKAKDKADWLFENNLKLKKWFINLRSRIECVEHSMGYYGGQDKYKS